MKILAIDDNPDNLTSLRAVMQDALPICTLLTALNGPRGLEQALAEDPDVILLDIVMPGMDGYEVCRRLKADDRLRPIPVVFLTALRTDRESRIQALESGAEAFLSKPFDEQELVAEVRAMAKIKAATLMQRDERSRLRSLVAERTRELQQSEERFRALFEQAPLGYLSLDAEGRFIEVNQTLLETLGYLHEDLIGKWFGEFMAPEFVDAFRERFPLFKTAGHIHSEFQMLHHDGHRLFIAFEGRIGYQSDGSFKQTHCILTDITKRKQAEAAVRESAQLLEGIINAIPVRVFWKDRNLVYLGCNVAFARDAGFADPKAVIGKDDYQMGWRAQADLYRGDDQAVIESGCPKLFIEEPQVTPEGKTLTLLTSKMPLLNFKEEIVGILGLYQDITAHKRNEAELQNMQKLQSIGTLAGGIAHDFNNILLGLFGNISMAMEDLPREHPSYVYLDEADKSMSRAVRLTKQLLTFAKGGAPVKENVSLGDMAEEVARFDLTGSNVSLVYHQAEDLWPVEADRGQLQQVVSNLVINARQAMFKGGNLTITLENADIPDASVPTLSRGRYVKVIVRDEGCGIGPKVIDQIFDPYFTTKPTGNGLGLATVWSIINKHGGHIGVVSELGKGTVFTFYLPAATSPQSAEAKPPAAECLSPASPAKILLMDDDEAISRLAVRMLKPCGYTVTTAPNAQEAIALYRQALDTGTPFDAVIMDLTIPGGPGGQEVIQALIVLDPHVRAIVSSGYAGDPVMANPTAYGFKGTVAKPYTARGLREVVAQVLA